MLCFSQQGLWVDGTLQTLCWKGSFLQFPSFPFRIENYHSNGPAATAHHRLLRQVSSSQRLFVTGTAAGPPPQLRDSPHPPLTKMRNVSFPLFLFPWTEALLETWAPLESPSLPGGAAGLRRISQFAFCSCWHRRGKTPIQRGRPTSP